MLHHYVLVTMKDTPDRLENTKDLKKKLLEICKENKLIHDYWVKLNEVWDMSIDGESASADLILFATYNSYEDLLEVRKDPLHVKMGKWLKDKEVGKKEVSFYKGH